MFTNSSIWHHPLAQSRLPLMHVKARTANSAEMQPKRGVQYVDTAVTNGENGPSAATS